MSKLDGKTATANFVSGLMQSVPPLHDLFNMAGMQLPTYLGKEQQQQLAEKEEKKEPKNKGKNDVKD